MLLFVFIVLWADVIALWQMEWLLFGFLFVMADVIAQWQMEWQWPIHLPLGNKAYSICQAITSAIDTNRHNICLTTKTKISVNII